ncbi:hypothetical protein MATR_33540 [Marivirga tractuosa]|uniref:Deoxyribose-phosphate aldolase n=1 Tax=Marivirga tractuosa (strain ATCC 23168 / DSM 4126 / NBRC 15989 / NCIMB 1408 / VKM B-1430 / H-43) TaxID=643867 RepID=E4TRV1_MARTH|nr:DUF6503 family protein [Marivirga tractuosa]ADR22800.1 hypothetical protein Ftrac_2822 [Marivirga tractuosa DSM 4126]BDD16529.1 hypothetical protein MATR_33540 [Marivirga tractuosa]
MKNFLGITLFSIIISACNPADKSPEQHIQNAVEQHGGDAYATVDVDFQFRDKFYSLNRLGEQFKYERIFEDSLGNRINDILDNDGFKRLIGGEKVELSPKDSAAYANSVNSVHYFALLPYNLQDEAVIAHNKEDVLIQGQPYKTIEVKFKQEGGGTDYEDVFMFWFNAETYDMDYFAYSYQTEGGGVRFRESINKEQVDGVIFQDYNNFKAKKGTELANLPVMFENGELELLSKIILEFDVEAL